MIYYEYTQFNIYDLIKSINDTFIDVIPIMSISATYGRINTTNPTTSICTASERY